MKKVTYFFSVLFLVFGITGCNLIFGGNDNGTEVTINVPVTLDKPAEVESPKFGEKEHIKNKAPTLNIQNYNYAYDENGNIEVGYPSLSSEEYKGHPILQVTPKGNGLEIKKYHNPIWWYVDIYVYNETRQAQSARINTTEAENKDSAADTYFYPFVNAGEEYRIYIIKQDKGYTNWTSYEYDSIYVTALGGDGDFYVNYKQYEYDNSISSIVFDELTLTMPENVFKNGSVSGGVYGDALWVGDAAWPGGLKFHDSSICLKDNGSSASFIKNKSKLCVSLHYDYEYNDNNYGKKFSYSAPLVEGAIYDASINNTDVICLEGGDAIPNVYITSSNGYTTYPTYHFGNNWENASISIEDPNGLYNLSPTEISIKDRGNSTKWTSKTPFSIKFNEKTKILGMKKAKRWVLMANYFDRSLIRTELAGYLGNDVFNSYWNASFTPVNVYINGEYYGTYDWGECNKINKQRIDVQSLADYADKDPEYSDVNGDGKIDINDAGFMVEIDTAINWDGAITASNYKTKVGVSSWAAGERIYFYSSEKCIPMTLKEPDFDDSKYSESDCEKYGKYAKSKIDAFEKMLYSRLFTSRYTDYIDPISFIDWYLINEFSKNSDANFQKSVPVTYNPATGKLYMGPNWDFDLAFGNFNHSYNSDFGSSTVDSPTGWYIYGGRKGCNENELYCQINGYEVQSWWINRLMQSKAFKRAIKARWNDRKIFLKNAINKQILDYANRIYDEIPENEAHLPRLGVAEWNGPSGYENRKTYEDEISYLYNWCIARYNWMDKEINKW